MIQRLPRQPGGIGGLLYRGTPEAVPAEHQHGGVENTGARVHLTIFTKLNELSNHGAATKARDAIARPMSLI